jgi:hypothetical protein
MSATREEVLRYGAGEIRGYVGGNLTLSITPSSILMPPVEIDHLEMPVYFKDKDVDADRITFSSNDSTHNQLVVSTGDLTVQAPANKTLYLTGDSGITASGESATLSGTTDANVTTSAGDTTISASGSVKITAGTTVALTGTTTGLKLTRTTGATGDFDFSQGGYYRAVNVDPNTGVDTPTTLHLWRLGNIVYMWLEARNTNSSQNSTTQLLAVIPEHFRPGVDIRVTHRVTRNSVKQMGHTTIFSSNGDIIVQANIDGNASNEKFAGSGSEAYDDVIAHWWKV